MDKTLRENTMNIIFEQVKEYDALDSMYWARYDIWPWLNFAFYKATDFTNLQTALATQQFRLHVDALLAKDYLVAMPAEYHPLVSALGLSSYDALWPVLK